MKHNRLHYPFIQHLLLCIIVVVIYSPAFWAEPCLLDDVALLEWLQGGGRLDLKSLLFPNSAHFTYYRPLIGLSYWFDQTFWNAAPYAMHAENVLFHMLNVVLLFWLIRLSLPDRAGSNHFVPLLGALLLAVHPIATESVSWISGRTDLLAGSCLLGAGIALVARQRNRDNRLLLFALPMLALGIMTKEVAWGFLLTLPLFLAEPYDSRTHTLGELYRRFSRLERLGLLAAVALCFLLAGLLLSFWPVLFLSITLGLFVFHHKPRRQPLSRRTFALLAALVIGVSAAIPCLVKLGRSLGAGDFHSTLSRTILITSLDLDNSITLFSGALAFYIRKFFLPLPLNFAITDIAPGYLFAGIAVLILVVFLCAWRSRAAILFLSGLALLLPALPLVHAEIAWTPYAERYIYISSAFWIAALAVGFCAVQRPFLRMAGVALCLVLIPLASLATFGRACVWQHNVPLFADTVRQSPGHIKSRVLYMAALSRSGKPAEALEQFRIIQKAGRAPVRYVNDLAEILCRDGLRREAYEVLDASLSKPLSGGKKHPLDNPEWRRLYALHDSLKREFSP
ncbi:hypothetical protein [Geobacter sp. SVR]|uniref:hypothetical protein n=1 Tax=Geobacter sp. SVR TaxID=2495594 RepID=UPI0015633789|nr:hypothetical protein [Geobacter sp. SVR]